MRFLRWIVIAVAFALAALNGASAADLGTIGPTYPIAEPHLLDFIRQRLLEKQRSGELKRLEDQARKRAQDTIVSPPSVAGITATETARTFYYDPSFVLEQPILGEHGQMLFPTGTRANPLEIVSLSKHLLFFDARDARQVTGARELIDRYHGRVKPVLVGGSYLALMKAWRTPVYFDQQGVLTRRLGISHVPALVSQEGLRLRIDELVLR